MRKNSKNEKVIRAMAIGISAMLMASSPLTALAAEGEGNSSEGNEDKNITVTPEAGVCDQAEAAAKDADKAVEGAEKSAADVKAEVVDKVAAGDVKDAGGKDLSQDILDANAKVEDKTVEDGSSLKDAESAVENADTALGVAEANDKLSDAELNKAADAAANAGQTAAEAKDAMQASQDKVNGQIENIKDAASITDANAAYEEVKTTVDQAQADFDAKLGEYNTAKAAYEEAAKKLADYEKAYEDAVNSADANADAAATELKAAQENAEALAKALEAAKSAVDTSAAGAMDIADKEALTQGDQGLNWKNEDKLFISIMQNYYLPEVLKITADDIKVVRRQGEDNNTKNYFEVTYTDENGNKQTKYYNYVMDDKQTSKDNIVIFEKRIEEVNWKTAQETNPDQYVKENGDTITVSEVEKGLKDGTIIAVDGKKVIKNDGTESIIISDNNQKTENGEVDTDVNEVTEKESWKLDENGNLVKTVTADVTTITYTDAKFTSSEQYQTVAERDAAAAEKEKELENANNGKECATIQTATLLHTTSRWLTVPYSPSIKIWRSLPSQTIFLTISLIKVRFSSIVSVWKLSLKLDNAVDSISTWISLSAMMFTSLCRRAFSSFMEASSLSSSVILAFTRSMNAAPKLPCDSVLIRLSISLLHFLILSSMTATGLFCVCPCKSRFSFSSSL